MIEEIHCMATGQAGAEIGIGTTLNCNHEAPIVTQEIVGSLCADSHPGSYSGQDAYTGRLVPEMAFKASHYSRGKDGAPAPVTPPLSADADKGDQYTLVCVHGTQNPCTDENLAFALGRNSGQENAIAFSCKDHGADAGDVSPTLRSMGHDGSHANGGGQVAVAFSGRIRGDDGRGYGREEQIFKDGITGPVDTVKPHCVAGTTMMVRRLMPLECARLQGFPDHHCDIKPNGKPTADGPQYKAYGNSMAVPVMEWIGRRIEARLKRP